MTRFVGFVVANPVLVLVLVLAATVAAGTHAYQNLAINASRDALISPEAAFLQNFNAFQDTFPAYKKTIVAVIEAENGQKAADAARDLSEALSARSDLFASAFAPAAEPFFRRNGLLYLSDEELERVVNGLARAQPVLTSVAQDPSLRGVFDVVSNALEAAERGEDLPDDFVILIDQIAATGRAALEGRRETLDLGALFGGNDGDNGLQVVTLQTADGVGGVLAGGPAVNAVRAAVAELGLTSENGYTVRLTGNVPLNVEEMRDVGESVGFAGALSLVLLAVILGFGLRSWRIIFAIFVTLFVGLIWTLGWAVVSVGEFNMISATFAVLFLGLGVDFAIHLCLRYQQALQDGLITAEALKQAASSVGGAVMLNGVTSAVGFLSFIPTGYKGVADLGIIAGGGMIIAVVASLTVLPAILALTRARPGRQMGVKFEKSSGGLFGVVARHARVFSVLSIIVAILAAMIATQARFDFSTLALKDPNSESLVALQRLQERGIATDFAIYLVADSFADAEAMAETLDDLPTVASVETPADLVPSNQDYKLQLLEETSFLLLPALQADADPDPIDAAERQQAVADLQSQIRTYLGDVDGSDEALTDSLRALNDVLGALTTGPESDPALQSFESALTSDIQAQLAFLRDALDAREVDFADLPAGVRERVVNADGQVRVVGIPAGDMTDFIQERALTEEVTAIFPDATGRPVLETGFGEVVVDAFRIALSIAISAILIILIIATRNLTDTFLIALPLIMAACFTAATGVVLNIPFNLANIIVLPLIVGLGVANGIHVVLRYQKVGTMDELIHSSTPRAVVLSTLTTIGAFGALSVSVHAGIRSMGQLLTIAMAYLLISTVVILPAFLYWRRHAVARRAVVSKHE